MNKILKLLEEVIEHAINSDNPVISIGLLLIIAFLLYSLSRRFFTTDYIKENKESREQLKQLNEVLTKDYIRLKEENIELKKQIAELELKIEDNLKKIIIT